MENTLDNLRQRLDVLDAELLRIFGERMEIVGEVAEYKRQEGLPTLDSKRESQKLAALCQNAGEELAPYVHILYDTIFELSRSHQGALRKEASTLYDEVKAAMESTSKLFPQSATVACQGTEGAFSQQACERLFRRPNIQHFRTFEGVFSSIENGFCDYGVIPLENSVAGSVNKVYSLLEKHSFKIVRSIRLKVDHALLVPSATKLEDIREIYSHEQAIAQCSAFLEGLADVRIIPCENTAMAAQKVAESGRADVAAIASHECARLYGLDCLARGIQDFANNYTRFICVSKNLEIYPGADHTSIMVVLPHSPGALYKTLGRFYALGINLNKLESRPMPDRDFEFMFYFDLHTSVYSVEFGQVLEEIRRACDEFKYLGSYSEVV